jgi:uncharacterized membrane protein
MSKDLKKSLCILAISLAVCAVLYPFLPNQIPRQFHLDGTKSYIAKEYIFLIGFIPFIVSLRMKKRK